MASTPPGALIAPEPPKPVRAYSFTDWQVNNPTAPPPGDRLDAEFDRANGAISQTLDWAGTSLSTDGTLRAGIVGESQLVPGLFDDIADDAVEQVQPLVDQAGASATQAFNSATAAQSYSTLGGASATRADQAATDAETAATTAQGAANGAQDSAAAAAASAVDAANSANHADGSEAVAEAYADVGMAWAEHMPDIIPPNILAVQGVTGDHWSSRWWANQAAITLSEMEDLLLKVPPLAVVNYYTYIATAGQVVFSGPDRDGDVLSYTPSPVVTLLVYANGLLRTPGDDYTGTADTVTFARPRAAGDVVQIQVEGVATTAGVYLPLTGGVMTGPITLAADPALPMQPVTLKYSDSHYLPFTGGALSGPGNLVVHGNLTVGTAGANVDFGSPSPFLIEAVAMMAGAPPPGAGLYGQFSLTIPSDTAAASGNSRGLSAIPVQYNYGGAGFTGGRTGLNVNLNQTGPITDAATHGFVAGNFQIFSGQPQSSGTAQMIALSASALLGAGGTGFGFVEALEIGAGSSAPISGRWGLTIFPLGSKQGDFGNDYAFSVGGIGGGTPTSAFWRAGYTFGRAKSPWGIDPGGSLFTVNTMTTGSDGPQPWLNQTAAHGFDFRKVNFSAAAFWTPGNKVLGDGTHQIGAGAIAPGPAGLSIDVVGYVGSNPTIFSGGSAYAPGDQVFDAFGGIYVITTVGGTGNITGITLTGGHPPYVYGAPGPATTPLIGGRSTNQDGVIGLTWTQQTVLALNPSGGTVSVTGKLAATRQDLIPGTTTFDVNGNPNPALNINTNLAGSTTGTGIVGWNRITVNADTMSMSRNSAIGTDFSIVHNFGGAGFKGSRLGQLISLYQVGAVAGTPGAFENIITGQQLSVTLNNPFGGSGVTPTTAAGFATCFNPFLFFGAGYTNAGGGSGMEVDIQTVAGSSFMDVAGILIVRIGTAQAAREDNAVAISSAAVPTAGQGWKRALSIGTLSGEWPMDPGGTIIGAASAITPRNAAWGVDWSNVNFSGGFLKGPSFLVDGAGRCAPLLTDAANDAAAASAGVPIGAMYRNVNAVQVRVA